MALQVWKRKIFMYFMKVIRRPVEIFLSSHPEQDWEKQVYFGTDNLTIHLQLKADIVIFHAGMLPIDRKAGGNISILSPGPGLGEAGLFWDGQSHHPFATEGGHCDFSCRNASDLQLHDYMQIGRAHV